MDEQEIEKTLLKYPFYQKWKEGKRTARAFAADMKASKEQLIKDEGLTSEALYAVLQRETGKDYGRKRWFEFWK
jgi:hypothetical protein